MKVETVKVVELDLEPAEDIKVGNYYIAGDHSTWDEGLTHGRAYRIVEVGYDSHNPSGVTGMLQTSWEFEVVNDSGEHVYMSRSALKRHIHTSKGQLMKEIEQ